jgi:two-component system, chemotaxis family, CheB/CheR fusion protein
MAKKTDQFPIVAIGASAGGIEALNAFLGAVPADSGMAYVILLHMPLNDDSKITDVLGAHIELPVKFAKTGVSMQPNTVYVAQPGFDVVLRDGSFIAHERDDSIHPQRPVDNLFESIAADVHERAIAIILSGTGTNGTAGIRAIKAEGGLVIAQSLSSTRFPGMPRSAIASGFVDLVLAPAAMPRAILDYASHPYMSREVVDDDESSKDRESDRQLSSVLALIKTRCNHDFRGYKKRTLTRRIFRRMGLRRVDTVPDYLLILRNEPEELKALVGDLLISVTGFFRDPEAWQELDERVITPLVQERDPDVPVRIWVPACATGEEAYTIAMLLLERCRSSQKNLDIKVFATDADTNALAKARAAVYPASAVAVLPQEQLTRFFDRQDDTYRVKKELRELVVFAPQDIVADPPFSRLDLITCRNLMIYLETPLQKRVLSLLHFALREGGYLFLGNAETVGGNETLFRVVSKKWRIFSRVGPTRHDLVDFPVAGAIKSHTFQTTPNSAPNRMRQKATDQAQRVMVDEYAPPSVLVDEHCRVLYYHGDTEPYLRQPAGEPTNDLLMLVREGIRSKLRGGVQKVLKEGKRTQFAVRVRRQTGYVPVHITIIPAQHEPDQELRLLISFMESSANLPAANPGSGDAAAESIITEHDIEEELRSVREELRSTIEQLESSNEEMKASNEEITSVNEELQSTNEELETSKEELQSLNEELNTVNTQLQSKVEELEDRTNDLNNLLNSADIATLFLDIRFSIRWFTPAMRDLLDILPTDIGRPVSHFALKFEDPAFLKEAELVLQTLIPRESEVRNEEGRWYMRRILPYRTEDNRIDGVVVTFTEITERRKWEEDIRQARDFAERILDTLQESLVVLEPTLRVKTANRTFFETFKLPRTDVEGRLMFDLGRGDWDIPDLRLILSPAELSKTRSLHHNATIEHEFRELGKRTLSVNIRLLDGGMILLVIKDVSDLQDFQRRQDILLAELQHRVKNILASVQAIARMTHQRSTSLEEFWESFQGRLIALATTQELLTRARVDRVELNELVVQELTAQGARMENYRVGGPPLNLTAKAAQNIALALHELTTNATKHGALTRPDGLIEVKWDVTDGQIRFEWIESGGPSVTKPSRRGFGTELIEKAIPYQLRGKTKLDYKPDGLHCTFEFGTPGNIVSSDNLNVFSPPVGGDKVD